MLPTPKPGEGGRDRHPSGVAAPQPGPALTHGVLKEGQEVEPDVGVS